MTLALIVIGLIVLIVAAIVVGSMIKEHLDAKARNKEYQDMLTRQKREAQWKSEISTYRSNTTTNYPHGGRISTSKPGKRYPVKRTEDGTYVVADSDDSAVYGWIDSPTDTISGWTSTTDDNSSGRDSTDYSNSDSGSSYSSDYGTSSTSDYGSSSSDSSSSSSSDSGSSSSYSSD